MNTPRTDKLYEDVWRFTNETDAVDALISMRDFCRELERENAALNHKLDEILTNKNYEGGVQFWINKHDEVLLRESSLRAKNAALLGEVVKANGLLDMQMKELAKLRADKERLDWLDHNAIPWTWMSPEKIDGLGPIVVTWKSNRTLRAAIDAARKEAQP